MRERERRREPLRKSLACAGFVLVHLRLVNMAETRVERSLHRGDELRPTRIVAPEPRGADAEAHRWDRARPAAELECGYGAGSNDGLIARLALAARIVVVVPPIQLHPQTVAAEVLMMTILVVIVLLHNRTTMSL